MNSQSTENFPNNGMKLYEIKQWTFVHTHGIYNAEGWRCSSVVRHLASMLEALGLIPQHHKWPKTYKGVNYNMEFG
jgi:hypothetical protein